MHASRSTTPWCESPDGRNTKLKKKTIVTGAPHGRSTDLARLEQDNATRQQDVGRKRQRLAMAAFMGRAHAEQPLAATKPARYIALHGVTAAAGCRHSTTYSDIII